MKKSTDAKELVRLFSRLALLTQLGLSVVTPPILCVLFALWLQSRFGVGDWVLLCAILLGVLSGVTGVFRFVRQEMAREARRDAALQKNGENPKDTAGTADTNAKREETDRR